MVGCRHGFSHSKHENRVNSSVHSGLSAGFPPLYDNFDVGAGHGTGAGTYLTVSGSSLPIRLISRKTSSATSVSAAAASALALISAVSPASTSISERLPSWR